MLDTKERVFAKLCENNCHASFQHKKYVQKTDTNFITTVLSFSVLVFNKYSNTMIPYGILDVQLFHSWIFLGVQLFLDIPGYSWIFLVVQLCLDQEKRRRKTSNFGFVGLFFGFLMQFMELTVHSK